MTSFSVPLDSLDFWAKRLSTNRIATTAAIERFGERGLAFSDPDGLLLELIASPQPDTRPAWGSGPIASENAIRGFNGVTVSEEGYERTAALLSDRLGFDRAGEGSDPGERFRFKLGSGGPGAILDVLCLPGGRPGKLGAGVVHHVAWRVADDAAQLEWQKRIADAGLNVSPVMDRTYFHSIYFREPGGVLFEIATDGPGFTADQPAELLGSKLSLPRWLEPVRGQIESALPRLNLPMAISSQSAAPW